MSYNTKNYTEQGGGKTVIGGELEVKDGAQVSGLLSKRAEHQDDLSASATTGDVKTAFNALLSKLKVAGIMVGDSFAVSVKAIPTKPQTELVTNHSKVRSITYANHKVTVNVPVDELISFNSSDPTQGKHKWLGLCFTTGLSTIIGAYFGEYAFAEADVTEATTCGGVAGDFVLWIKTEIIADEPRVITISKPGYETETITIEVVDNED